MEGKDNQLVRFALLAEGNVFPYDANAIAYLFAAFYEVSGINYKTKTDSNVSNPKPITKNAKLTLRDNPIK